MNIMNKLTLRTLKENKRRTIITVIGVIISVAMLTAVSTIATSFMDAMQRQEIANNGEWHVQFGGVKREQIDSIVNDDQTKDAFLTRPLGYSYLEGSGNEHKPYLYVRQFDPKAYDYMQVKLVEGRLPQASGEAVITQDIRLDAGVDLKIGDILDLEVGERYLKGSQGEEMDQSWPVNRDGDKNLETLVNTQSMEFKIVGIIETPKWEFSWSPGYTVLAHLERGELNPDDTVDVNVIAKHLNRSLFSEADHLANDAKVAKVTFNSGLLRTYGVMDNDNLNAVMYSIVGILMAVIMIGSISLIYNAFAISVSERARYLGMLSSIGATKKQKRNSVFYEGAIIGVISIPLGIGIGILGIWLTFQFINTYLSSALFDMTEKLRVVVTPGALLLSVLVSVFTIFISAFIPARKASKISAIDAIRQTQDIKLTQKQVKTSKLIRKLFGFEAEIGLKNLKRNKRRYLATVFSIVISIVLFMTVSYFTDNLKKSYGLTDLEDDSDIFVTSYDNDQKEFRQAADEIIRFDEVTKASLMLRNYNMYTKVDKSKLGKVYLDWYENNPYYEDPGDFTVTLYGLSDESLKSYMEEAGIKADFSTNEGIPAVVVNSNKYRDQEDRRFVGGKVFEGEIGDTLEIASMVWEEDKEEPSKIPAGTLTVVGLTDVLPLGATKTNYPNELTIIVSEEDFWQLVKKEENYMNYELYLYSNNPSSTVEKIEDLNISGLYVFNKAKEMERGRQFIIMMNVFIYGFISLITAISVANIFNTITTSIALRKREFAMLKSVGMTPKGFNKMINYESLFYGIKALLYGLPISFLILYGEYRSFQNSFVYSFEIPWKSLIIVVLSVFIIVGSAMIYSSAKIKKENIIEGLRQENL